MLQKMGWWLIFIIHRYLKEIGPLAEWMPSHETTVTPFAAEKYPMIVKRNDFTNQEFAELEFIAAE